MVEVHTRVGIVIWNAGVGVDGVLEERRLAGANVVVVGVDGVADLVLEDGWGADGTLEDDNGGGLVGRATTGDSNHVGDVLALVDWQAAKEVNHVDNARDYQWGSQTRRRGLTQGWQHCDGRRQTHYRSRCSERCKSPCRMG